MGTFVKLEALETIDIVAGAGFDFVVVDLEHSQLSEGAALRLVRHAHALGFPALVRIPACDSGLVNRLLEAGASGIQLSSVRRAAQVEDLVAASRYPPSGTRSVSLAHPLAGYGAIALKDVVAADPPLLVGQIESGDTDDPLDEIAGAGLDVLFIGLTDLLVDLGFDEERLNARVEEISKAAAATGVVLGAFASDPSGILEGARYVALSSDVALLQRAARKAATDAR